MIFKFLYSEIYYLLYQDNHITSFDFNPSGELVATIDFYGQLLVADVNTDSYIYHLDIEGGHTCKLDLEICSLSFFLSNYLFPFLLLINFIFSNFFISDTQDFDSFKHCWWSTNTGEPILFVRYCRYKFNILDVEKKTLTLKELTRLRQYRNFSRNLVLSPLHFFSSPS